MVLGISPTCPPRVYCFPPTHAICPLVFKLIRLLLITVIPIRLLFITLGVGVSSNVLVITRHSPGVCRQCIIATRRRRWEQVFIDGVFVAAICKRRCGPTIVIQVFVGTRYKLRNIPALVTHTFICGICIADHCGRARDFCDVPCCIRSL